MVRCKSSLTKQYIGICEISLIFLFRRLDACRIELNNIFLSEIAEKILAQMFRHSTMIGGVQTLSQTFDIDGNISEIDENEIDEENAVAKVIFATIHKRIN